MIIPLGILASSYVAPASSSLTVTYQEVLSDTADGTSYTFSVVHAGASGDVIVLGPQAEGNAAGIDRNITAFTFDSSSVTAAVVGKFTSAVTALYAVTGYGAGTYSAQATFDFTMSRAVLGVWIISGGASATATAVDSDGASVSTGLSTTVDVLAGEVAVGVCHTGRNNTHSWSGATSDFYTEPEGGLSGFSGASVAATGSARLAHVISTSFASSDQPSAMSVAVFGGAA